MQTSQDARFYALSSRFDSFSNKGKTLVVQFTVKHEQNIDCGGGYVKLFPKDLDQKDMHGDSEYNIMFGEGPWAGAGGLESVLNPWGAWIGQALWRVPCLEQIWVRSLVSGIT